MKYIISTPPNDVFSFPLFNKLLASVTCEYDAYYIWATPPEALEDVLNHCDFSQKPNVIIGIKDMLDLWKNYHYWRQQSQAGTQLIDATLQRYPDTNFIILTSLENLHLEPMQSTNVQIVPWGGDLVNQIDQYKKLEPVLNKNFSSAQHAISLNRNRRDHRVVCMSYLFGKNLETSTYISFLIKSKTPNISSDFLDIMPWVFDASPDHDRIRQLLIDGYKKLLDCETLTVDPYKIYDESTPNDNFSNFNNSLRGKYENSFVEIVSESSFDAPGYMLTEKTMHVFYGCNFPILLSGCGAVQHLREVGFDMFDDIVDHGYDNMANPIDRIAYAIDWNERLLTDADYAKSLWQANQHRFVKNVEVAKNIDAYYRTRALDLWNKIIWK
jgi:hypothetical protein